MKVILLLISFIFSIETKAQSLSYFLYQVDEDSSRSLKTKSTQAHKDVWKNDPIKLLELGDNWIDGDKEGFVYLGESERQKYKLTFENGKVWDYVGNEYNTSTLGAMFVMTEDGSIYASKRVSPGTFEHHSLVAGKPVVCAGRLIVHAGKLQKIDDISAQYKAVDYYPLTKVVTQLKNNGISFNNVSVLYNANK